MTVDDLLKPRYKVIARVPVLEFQVGEIFIGDCLGFNSIKYYYDRYPAIFKRLEWWEDREKYFWSEGNPSSPLFVSNISKTFYGSAWGIDLTDGSFVLEVLGEKTSANLCNYLPATQTEYDSYINKKP